MEAAFVIVCIVLLLWFATTNSKTSRPRRKIPPKFRPNTSHRRYSGQRKQTASNYNETPAARSARANSRKRITNGIEHDPPPPIPTGHKIIGRAWVIEGDTIRINQIKIRLAGIDAPELDEPWGRKSKWAMVNICKGKTIHVDLTGETSYDRLVGTCYLPDGTDIGAELVKEGLALDGSYYSKGKYLHLEPEGARKRLGNYGLKQRWK